jgi:hypothetical protein
MHRDPCCHARRDVEGGASPNVEECQENQQLTSFSLAHNATVTQNIRYPHDCLYVSGPASSESCPLLETWALSDCRDSNLRFPCPGALPAPGSLPDQGSLLAGPTRASLLGNPACHSHVWCARSSGGSSSLSIANPHPAALAAKQEVVRCVQQDLEFSNLPESGEKGRGVTSTVGK